MVSAPLFEVTWGSVCLAHLRSLICCTRVKGTSIVQRITPLLPHSGRAGQTYTNRCGRQAPRSRHLTVVRGVHAVSFGIMTKKGLCIYAQSQEWMVRSMLPQPPPFAPDCLRTCSSRHPHPPTDPPV